MLHREAMLRKARVSEFARADRKSDAETVFSSSKKELGFQEFMAFGARGTNLIDPFSGS
jgi:hypothetical protein